MGGATRSLLVAILAASVVESVKAFTGVRAMGITRGWRSALTGAAGWGCLLVGARSLPSSDSSATAAQRYRVGAFATKIERQQEDVNDGRNSRGSHTRRRGKGA